jgi:hypothetical protein
LIKLINLSRGNFTRRPPKEVFIDKPQFSYCKLTHYSKNIAISKMIRF